MAEAQQDRSEGLPLQKTEKKETSEGDTKRIERDNEKHRVLAKIDKLEKSDIAPVIKEMLNGFLEQNLQGEMLHAYSDKIKEKGSTIKIADFLEGISEVMFAEDPEFERQFREGNVTSGSLIEGIFDRVFQEAQGGGMQKEQYEDTLKKFKAVMSE